VAKLTAVTGKFADVLLRDQQKENGENFNGRKGSEANLPPLACVHVHPACTVIVHFLSLTPSLQRTARRKKRRVVGMEKTGR
jgi:hypothetical protein